MKQNKGKKRKYIEVEDDDDEQQDANKGISMRRRDSGIVEKEEEENCLIIAYTDGSFRGPKDESECSCLNRAGYGIYFPTYKIPKKSKSQELFFWGRVPGKIQNSRRAEIYAVIRAIQLCPDKNAKLHIFTDYKTTTMMKTDFRSWSIKGTSDMDLWITLRREMYLRKHVPTLSHVKGHSGNHGNNKADEYAKKGTQLKCEKDECRITMKQISTKTTKMVEVLEAL
ncbi:hypothetical protein L7F22_019824 [Adiantum nelumboides]|nr:hypothetical protein [Adiantum nelumboides]